MSAPPTGRAPEPAPRRLAVVLALAAILLLGAAVRLDDLSTWREDAASTFVDGAPLLANFDGYWFLSLARDLLEDGYAAHDPLRAAPAGVTRPQPPPLLSVLAAALTRGSGLPLEWSAVLLPAVLGPLLALPMFAVARRLAGTAAGLTAATIAVLSHYYVYRTTAGFFDTDALNVTLCMAMTWWALGTARAPAAHFGRWLTAGVALYLVWAWWWTGAGPVVTALGTWALLGAMALRAPARRERLLAALTCAGLAAGAVALGGADLPGRGARHLVDTVRHVTKAPGGDFPNIAASIGEQAPAGLAGTAERTLGDPVLLALAVVGFGWLMLARRRAVPLLLAPLALALLGVLFAQRFLIFAAPVTGLGAGFLAARALAAAGGRRWMGPVIALGVAAAAAPSLIRGLAVDVLPATNADMVAGMRWASRETPPDAVMWALWDHGYSLRYWSRRATIADGAEHDGELAVYGALPFAAPSFRLAANFMQFYSVHGRQGLQAAYRAAGGAAPGLELVRGVLAAGPQTGRALVEQAGFPAPGGGGASAWIAFLFPGDPPPLYLMTDERMLHTARWWFGLGAWRPGADAVPALRLEAFRGVTLAGDRMLGPRLQVDADDGRARIDGGEPIPLSRIVVATTRGLREQRFAIAGPEFHLFALDGLAVLADPPLARSVFTRIYVLRASSRSHFEPAYLAAGLQLWRVRGDRLR